MTSETPLHRQDLDGINGPNLSSLQSIHATLNTISTIDDLCWKITDWVGELSDLDDCVVYLRVGNVLVQMAALGIKRGENPLEQNIVDRIGLPIGSGIVGHAAVEGDVIYIPDVTKDERYLNDVYPGASELAVPIQYRQDILGVVDCENSQVDGISEKQRQLIISLCVLAAPHIAELLRKPNPRAPTYAGIITDLAHSASSTDFRRAFSNITERATRALRVSRANIWLFQDQQPHILECIDQYDALSHSHTSGAELDTNTLPDYVHALRQERVIMANDAAADPRTKEFAQDYLPANNIKSMLDAPIRMGGNVVGVLCLEQMETPRTWNEEEASFVGTMSDFATIAMTNHEKSVAETALIQSQKMESLGRLAGGIAHDFNNLLTVISGAAETLKIKLEREYPEERMLNLIFEASERASRLTKNLMAFGGQQYLQMQNFSIETLLNGVRSLTEGIIREDINIIYEYDNAEHYVNGDLTQLEQVILNLMINGVDAMPNGGVLKLNVHQESERIGVSISDTGGGMSKEVRSRIFDPFFTTKGEMGTGLGLSISLGIVHQHGGSLTCVSSNSKGTTFELWLPLSTPDLDYELSQDAAPLPTEVAQQKILLVEDEEDVRRVVTNMLETIGFEPLVAHSPQQALTMLRKETVDLLVSDVIMPQMRGPELYQEALKLNPNLVALFVSGYTQEVMIEMPTGDERVNFLSKPFTIAQLKQAIEDTRLNAAP